LGSLALAVKDFTASLGPLGEPREFNQMTKRDRGGMTLRIYHAKFDGKALDVWVLKMPDGKIEQYQVMPAEN